MKKAEAQAWVEFIDAESNVRSGPTTTDALLFVPPVGTRAQVLSSKGKWRKLRFTDGREAWTNIINLRPASAPADVPAEPAAAPSVPAAETPDAGGPCRRVLVDLTGDGTAEEIRLDLTKMRRNDPDDADYHLVVARADPKVAPGKAILWEDKTREFSFYIGHAGVEDLQVAGDLDGDGAVELVSPRAQSDVRPVVFRVFRWQGGRMSEIDGGFLYGDGNPTPTFSWSLGELDQFEGLTWVSGFLASTGRGEVRAGITSQQNTQTLFGEALLKAAPGGFRLVKWLTPLQAGTD